MKSKVCTACGIPKPETDFSPAHSRRHPHLRRGKCKECRAEEAVRSRQEFPEKYQASERKRYAKHGEKRRETSRQYHANQSLEKRQQINIARRPKWRAAYAAEPEKFRAKNKTYQQAHPEKWVLSQAKRRARKKGLPDTFSHIQRRFMLQYWGYACAVCGNQQGLLWGLADDHWIALANPACPGTISANMVPLCDGPGGCNNSKSDQDGHAWLLDRFGKRKATIILKKINAYFTLLQQHTGGTERCADALAYSRTSIV